MLLGAISHQPATPIVAVTVIAAFVFVGVVCVAKWLTGTEYIVYFHHEIAILAASVGVLLILRAPILFYLDLTIIGVLIFMGFGRIGCLMVGCCYGRPARAGVRYGDHHVSSGFPAQLAGVTLTPVQAFESLTAFAVAALGARLVLTSEPGVALAWCIAAYGAARFFILEPLRGDARPHALGLSHAQWIAATRAAALLLAVAIGAIPAGTLSLALAVTTVAVSPILIGRAR